MRLRVLQKVPGGIYALAIVGCCLPLAAGAASSGTDRLRIRAIAPDEATRFIRGEHWTIYLDGTIDAGAADRLSGISAAGAVRASIRVDDAFVPLTGKAFYAKNGDVVGMADLAPATVERLRRAAEIGFAFHPLTRDIFWGFAVEVGEYREKVDRYFSACEAR